MIETIFFLLSDAVIGIMGWIIWLYYNGRSHISVEEPGYIEQFRYAQLSCFMKYFLNAIIILTCIIIVYMIYSYHLPVKHSLLYSLESYIIAQAKFLFLLLIFCHLNFIFTSFEKKYIFTISNFGHIKSIGEIIIVSCLISMIIQWGFFPFHSTEFFSPAMALMPLLNNLKGLFLGAMVFIIAEVFRCSIEIKQENDLTV